MGYIENNTDEEASCFGLDQNSSSTLHVIAQKYPSLSAIADPIWHTTLEHARAIEIPKDAEIYTPTRPCNQFALMLEGSVRVYYTAADGREITLYRVVPGEICVLTLSHLVNGQPSNAIARTESPVNALIISDTQFRQLMAESEQFRNFVLATLSERLSDLMCLVQDAVFQNLHVRIACVLDKMFRRQNSRRLQTTHQSLAQEIGTSREVISRILKEFEKENYIQLSRGTIEITSYDDIHRLAHPTFC